MYLKKEKALKLEARRSLRENFLKRWWCKKYVAPPTDARFLAYTQEDLVIEYYEDVFEKNPKATFELLEEDALNEEQDSIMESVETDDPLLQEIIKREAKGESIDDLLEMMDEKPPNKNVTTFETKSKENSFWEKTDGK